MHFQGLLFILLLLNGDLYNVECAFEKLEHFVHQRERRSTLSFNKEVGCPDGWKALGKKCYYIESDSPKTYDGAASYCRNLGGFLASIHSKFEQDFLTAYLGESDKRGNVWIGLKNKKRTRGVLNPLSYILDEWEDLTEIDYSNFAPVEPGSLRSQEKCIHMEHAEAVAGKWGDYRCDALKGFLCQLKRSDDVDEKSYYFGNNVCPEGWLGYRERCYKLVDEKKNWKNAELVCQTYGSHLVSFSDSFQEAFISILSTYYGLGYKEIDDTGSFWIGLSDTDPKADGILTWSDASLLFHTNWDTDSGPNWETNLGLIWGANRGPKWDANKGPKWETFECGNSNEPRCTVVNVNKMWGIKHCSTELPFVCAKDRNQKNKSQIIFDGRCPRRWMDFGSKYCYYVEFREEEDFPNAKLECGRKAPKAKLAEFLSEDEMRLVLRYLKNKDVNKAFWMEIKAETNEFKYVTNGSIKAYLPLGEDEPNNTSTDNCVELSVRRFSYNNIKCSERRPYICQIDKDVIEQIELHGHVLPEPPKTEHHIRTEVETKNKGAKIAIIVVIATVAIVAFVATLIYKWHQKKTPGDGAERVTFDNQD